MDLVKNTTACARLMALFGMQGIARGPHTTGPRQCRWRVTSGARLAERRSEIDQQGHMTYGGLNCGEKDAEGIAGVMGIISLLCRIGFHG